MEAISSSIWSIGDVTWVDRTNATNKQLAYVNSAGHAILKVDNTTNVLWNEKRDTVGYYS